MFLAHLLPPHPASFNYFSKALLSSSDPVIQTRPQQQTPSVPPSPSTPVPDPSTCAIPSANPFKLGMQYSQSLKPSVLPPLSHLPAWSSPGAELFRGFPCSHSAGSHPSTYFCLQMFLLMDYTHCAWQTDCHQKEGPN